MNFFFNNNINFYIVESLFCFILSADYEKHTKMYRQSIFSEDMHVNYFDEAFKITLYF